MSSLNHPTPTALVTGATAGLGKEVAVRLARDGMNVVVVGRDATRGAAVVDQIHTAGGEARFIATDLSDPPTSKTWPTKSVTLIFW
jgi:short-subunit dehydrogenase